MNVWLLMNPWLLTLPIAYLLGSIPFGYLLVRLVRKEDIRQVGSGNIGATNVLRSGAKGLGIATLLLDLLKGYIAVRLARHIAPANYDLAVGAAVAAVLGHVFPVWLRFRGGKGVATALGVFLALVPMAALVALAVFIVIVLLTRYVSLASILAAAVMPIAGLSLAPLRTPLVIAGFLFLAVLIIVKHHANIRRLLAGTENRFGGSKKVIA